MFYQDDPSYPPKAALFSCTWETELFQERTSPQFQNNVDIPISVQPADPRGLHCWAPIYNVMLQCGTDRDAKAGANERANLVKNMIVFIVMMRMYLSKDGVNLFNAQGKKSRRPQDRTNFLLPL